MALFTYKQLKQTLPRLFFTYSQLRAEHRKKPKNAFSAMVRFLAAFYSKYPKHSDPQVPFNLLLIRTSNVQS